VAAALSYLFGWIGGLFFLLFDPRPFVRYHAAQSVVVFGTLSLLLVLLGGFFLGAFFPGAEGLLMVLQRIVEVTWLVLAVFLIFKASSGKRFRVPYVLPRPLVDGRSRRLDEGVSSGGVRSRHPRSVDG